jgi:uncharacterized protein (DUF697 family)
MRAPVALGRAGAIAATSTATLLHVPGVTSGKTERAQARAVEQTIQRYANGAAMAALQPFPFVDGAVITTLQKRMIESIGRIRGFTDKRTSRDVFRALRGRLVRPQLAIAGVKLIPLVPIVPTLVAFSIANALTYALGEVSDDLFRSPTLIAGAERSAAVRARFDRLYSERFARTYRDKRAELLAKLRRSDILGDQAAR